MSNKCLYTVGILLVVIAAAAPRALSAQAGTFDVSTAAMDAHLRFLSSDLLEGRAPATRGGRLASEYITAVFRSLGLEPGGQDSSYFQPVALVGMTPQPTFTWGNPAARLAYRDDFVAWAERPEADVAVEAEVVFVGYGIRAPEWQWDDYKGANLRGTILLMLVNDPGLVDSSVFQGKVLTYYGRWTYKL
ncbi:MAG: peptidase M28, partial [Gemmatimonadales bacterium]